MRRRSSCPASASSQSREGREPALNALNGREVRLADALAFLRRLARQRRAEMAGADAGADGEGTGGRPVLEMVDYLNDPLLATPDEKAKTDRTPLLERAVEVLERINTFFVKSGAEPVSAKGRSVVERMLANELAGLRASRVDLDGLGAFDRHGLVFARRAGGAHG